MTSEGDSLKTNEFLRLRKLRLQQVREQSKDIAKKIRQRAKVEQLKRVSNVDTNKEKIYLQRQEQLVNRLEELCSKGLANIGTGHRNASEVNLKDSPEKKDLSKLRGKEAAAKLRRIKQAKLDEKKKLLDRKLQARDAANELSREKSVAVLNNLAKTSSVKSINKECDKTNIQTTEAVENTEDPKKGKSTEVPKNDMGTQWEFDEIPNEWEPNIPALSIPKDDNIANDNVDKSAKSKRLNLFALSDEMPSSLRGGMTSTTDDKIPIKPSLTLVSEYIQNRDLRLRQPDTTTTQKKSSDDLQSIKETLLRTRASRTDGSVCPDICHILDEQIIPVPCWRAVKNCEFCSHRNRPFFQNDKLKTNNLPHNEPLMLRQGLKNVCLSFDRSNPCTWTSHCKCYHRHEITVSGRSNNIERSGKTMDNALSKKNSVTVYDHNTRDTRDLPRNVERLVVRDQSIDDDAYSQALKESEINENGDKPYHKTQQEMRNRVAVTKQSVEKEYNDTLAFLNSLPKEKPTRSSRTAYMDGDRQRDLKDRRQQRMEQEYRKIERDCRKHHCKHSKCKTIPKERSRSKSKSPLRVDIDNNLVDRNFQYSWLPVPESDGKLVVHTIPNTVRDKPGNTVKFSSVDTYHEYRSRHKHTPPTKDIDCEKNKRVVEAVIIQENSNDSVGSSYDTDTSSVDNLQADLDNPTSNRPDKDKKLCDAEKIIIYKVMESKKNKKPRAKDKNIGSIKKNNEVNDKNKMDKVNDNILINQVKEGIYKTTNKNGDNITSMYFSDDHQEDESKRDEVNNLNREKLPTVTESVKADGCDSSNRASKTCGNCKCKGNISHQHSDKQPSAATSTSSFKTALNEKSNKPPADGGYIKFVDEGLQDTGKFYVGASGFLKDDAYEVVIQLRKAERNTLQDRGVADKNNLSKKNDNKNDLDNKPSTTVQPSNQQVESPKDLIGDILTKSFSKETVISMPTETDVVKQQLDVPNQDAKASTQIETNISLQQNVDVDNKTIVDTPKICDKNIGTSFHDSFAIPDNVPKLDNIPKPTTSTYTQTTQNTSIPRPALMHLSSSTSTTYMSPPDLILPRYLRKGSSETFDRILSNTNSQNSKIRECKGHRCNKFHANTPPNSTRSTDQTTDICDSQKYYKNYSRCGHKHRKIKPHKCKDRSESKIGSKQKFKRSFIENKRTHTGSNYSSLSNKKSRMPTNLNKANLNPIIENYVKKLLALNKEGLKAIEVVNQECSAVTTPGSSIIDVSSNLNKNGVAPNNKISLEQIRINLKEQILRNIEERRPISKSNVKNAGSQTERQLKALYRSNRKRPVHKVKSLNISKQFTRIHKEDRQQSAHSTIITTSPLSIYSRSEQNSHADSCNDRPNSGKNMSTTRSVREKKFATNKSAESKRNKSYLQSQKHTKDIQKDTPDTKIDGGVGNYQTKPEKCCKPGFFNIPFHKGHSSESEVSNVILDHRQLSTPPNSISTQTNQVDSEVEFMKLAENKLQNMEKIADLTEKCTKRLSNLAKVLEEVRKNKSLAYSQISTSDSTSDSDQRSDKNFPINNNRVNTFNPTIEIQTLTEALSSLPSSPKEGKNEHVSSSSFVPILMDIPKPDSFKTPSPVSISLSSEDVDNGAQQPYVKSRGKPPPALTRNLKHVPEGFIIPHELSTVLEVDSPMSVKHKSHPSRLDSKNDNGNIDSNGKTDAGGKSETQNTSFPPTDTDSKIIFDKSKSTKSDDSKIKMMDLEQFNEIMLKPFISLQDYAKQYNLVEPDNGSGRNIISKDEHIHEELSSLHSETSLPDVMAELLKRNLISEPFKFETTSNVNSTTVSSESTISMLALSKVRKEKKKSGLVNKSKENVETSGSLSLSSNPDLENAFQKLGMGWASSTLKKTKERLALSSSSNTSSSSLPQFKIKSFNYQDIPELSKDSVMSLLNISNKKEAIKTQGGNISDLAKTASQQTSLTNSMTVKEFLDNKLAKKITFSNKSNKNATEDDFISLYETKMPEELKRELHKSEKNEKSVNTPPNAANNRARTSTPVHIFKSMTYHSTSSSNTSNGLFSNADELSSVKGTSNSNKNHSTSDKDDLTIPNYSLKMRKGLSECSKSD